MSDAEPPAWPPSPLTWPAEPLSDGVVDLDRLTDDDVPRLVVGAGDSETARWIPVPHPYTARDAREFLALVEEAAQEGRMLAFGLRRAGQAPLCGAVALHLEGRVGEAEIGFWVAPDARGEGLAPRGVRLVARHAISALGCHRLELLTHPDNTASQRACERAGALREGVRRAGIARDDREPLDAVVYSLLPGDLAAARA